MDETMVTISKKEYEELQRDRDYLFALQEAGVDNWEGYSEAMRSVAKSNAKV